MKSCQQYFTRSCYFTILCGLFLSAAGVNAETGLGAQHDAQQSLFPMEVSRSWTYRVHFEGKPDSAREVTNGIIETIDIEGVTWYSLQEYGDRFWIRNSDIGQMEAVNIYGRKPHDLEGIDSKVIRQEVMFKFPVKKGESWVILENTLRYEGLESKKVPAGEFQCHLYSITQYGQTYSHSCIAEDIGVVYSDNILENGEKEISELLHWQSPSKPSPGKLKE